MINLDIYSRIKLNEYLQERISEYVQERNSKKMRKYVEEAKLLLKTDFLDLKEKDTLRVIFYKAEDLEDEKLSESAKKMKEGLLEKIFHKLNKEI